MNKEKRKKGEEYLKKWASAILEIEKAQTEINLIKKGVMPKIEEKMIVQEKIETIDCYKNIIDEKIAYLKNIIKSYKFIEDIINSLEEYERKVIEGRYVYKKDWQAVAFNSHISLRQCFNIKNKVINEILEKEECQEQNLYSF